MNSVFGLEYREMVKVPAGKMKLINSRDTNEFVDNQVSSFQIAKFETTYELWYSVYRWAINNEYIFANSGNEGGGECAGVDLSDKKHHPVTKICWRDAIVWCNAYSEISKLTPVYVDSNGRVIKNSTKSECDIAKLNGTADGYRLPTECEWLYAASYQDGENYTACDLFSGALEYSNTELAWYGANANEECWSTPHAEESGVQAVGLKKPNQLGIYDMTGNIWEWCWDWYQDWPCNEQVDYAGPEMGTHKVARGGSWNLDDISCMAIGYRTFSLPSKNHHHHRGLRVAMNG